jgi:hypothetical protein
MARKGEMRKTYSPRKSFEVPHIPQRTGTGFFPCINPRRKGIIPDVFPISRKVPQYKFLDGEDGGWLTDLVY